jgi:hypothetical protein
MNVDFSDNIIEAINKWIKINCDIESSWGKWWLIGYLGADLGFFLVYISLYCSFPTLNRSVNEITAENLSLNENILPNESQSQDRNENHFFNDIETVNDI